MAYVVLHDVIQWFEFRKVALQPQRSSTGEASGTPRPTPFSAPALPSVKVVQPIEREITRYDEFSGTIENAKVDSQDRTWAAFDVDERTVLAVRRMRHEEDKRGHSTLSAARVFWIAYSCQFMN